MSSLKTLQLNLMDDFRAKFKDQYQLDARLVAVHQAKSLVAEQYRKLYVSIISAGQTRDLQILMITSSMAEEGKTLTALNLAITMTASGDNILLVETDFHRPRVGTYLDLPSEVGLSDYLSDQSSLDQICQLGPLARLVVVQAGNTLHNPVGLLSSQKMAQFLQQVKAEKQYRYIVLDAPPILLSSETHAMADYVDASILVIRAHKTPQEQVLQAIETLGEERLLGCVLNGIRSSDMDSYGSYDY
jgi:capsular exopolysaccharide synthesis family protein